MQNIIIGYTPRFIRQYKKLYKPIQAEVKEKIELFKKTENHQKLKVHALSGVYKNTFSFSINYSYRIIFEYINKERTEIALLQVGNHDLYK